MTEIELSQAIEDLLVTRNLRHMKTAQRALRPGYYLRGAQLLRGLSGTVVIATGFPVDQTFETDGPVGAIALYNAFIALGCKPYLACAAPLSQALRNDYELIELRASNLIEAEAEARENLKELKPDAVISIERPGLTEDGRYYNMRGEDITPKCGFFDPYMELAQCPTIAIGDGGNEIGMGNIIHVIEQLDIKGSTTQCNELLVADVSNWGAYGLIAFLALWAQQNLLEDISPRRILRYLSDKGSVDGVTRKNTLTEDGLSIEHGEEILRQLKQLIMERST